MTHNHLGLEEQEEQDPLLSRFKKSKTPPNALVKFNDSAGVRLSEELYNIDKVRWSFSTYGFRTLFAIAQSIDKGTWYDDVFIKQSVMFQYLGLQNTGQRYKILSDALEEVQSTTITRKNSETKKWEVFGFINQAEFVEGGNFIQIEINRKAKPLLFELKQFVQIQPKFYLALKDEYQNWLYPMLKLRVGGRQSHYCRWEMSIEDIATALQLDKKQPNKGEKTKIGAYDKRNKKRVSNILQYVIGIKISDEAQNENRRASVEHRKPKEIPWDYSTNRAGIPNGTIYTISKETDIEVKACAVKDGGRAYSKVIFFVSLKDETLSAEARRIERLQIINAAEEDMGPRRKDKEESLITIISNHTAPQKPIYTGKQLMDFCRENNIPNVKTVAQAAAVLHKKKIGDDQYQ